MPRYRIQRNCSGDAENFRKSEIKENCTEDEPLFCAESILSRKEEEDVVVANPQLIPQPYHCENWFPKFVYLNSETKKAIEEQESIQHSDTTAETTLQAKRKFICESLRSYYVPDEQGKYSFPYWTALEHSCTETNISELLLEEIALEGLDGITLQALWERLKIRLRRSEISLSVQNYFWEVIRKIPLVIFYHLPEARNDLQPIYREDYADDRGNAFQPAWAPEEIYSYEPIVDKKKKVRGSCATYRKRKCKSKYFASKSYTETLKYGNKMVIVAPQHIRENVLCGEDYEEEYPLTVAQYCMLERIGRARREGEQTKGNVSLFAMKLENKSSFHYRRDILELGAITRQTYAMKFPSSRTTSWISIFHLPRYFTPFETVPVKSVKRLIFELRSNPKHFQEYFDIQKKYGKPTMKFITDPMIAHILHVKEESQAELYPQLYENVKSESKKAIFKKRMIKVVYLSDAQVSEGEIDILLREIQENHVPKNERIVEEYDEDNEENSDENVITEDETMLYKLLVYIHESGGLGVTLEEIAVYFSVGKLDARTAIRAIQRKKCLKSYWEGRGKTKCRRYFLTKFANAVGQEIKDPTTSEIIRVEHPANVVELPKVIVQDDDDCETDTHFVVVDHNESDFDKFNVEIVNSYSSIISKVENTREVKTVQATIFENISNNVVPLGNNEDRDDEESQESRVNESLADEGHDSTQEIANSSSEERYDIKMTQVQDVKFVPNTCNNVMDEAADVVTESREAVPVSVGAIQISNSVSVEETSSFVESPKGKKRRTVPAEEFQSENIPAPPKKRKQMYDEIDRAAIQKRKKQRVEWSAEEDHCILIIFVASVVFIPNYVLGKTFIFNAPQIRDLLHKNIRDSANKTQTAVRRRLHFLMKQRKFNARYRYYLSATFSDDRVFKFVERHINEFKRPGRGFLEISVSALSAVYTYIMTHFVGINAFNEEDENFIDAPSFGQLTALRSYRRSEISEEFLNAEDDLTGENAEAPTADTIRQKEQKKEWSLKMCQMKARQIHPNPDDFIHIVDGVLRNYMFIHENQAKCRAHSVERNIRFNNSIFENTMDHSSPFEEIQHNHSWRTDRKKTYWERNIVLGVNEPRNISEVLIWHIRTVIIRILLTSKHAASIRNYLSKLPEYYLDYIIFSLREMEIASHSKRAKHVRLAWLTSLYRGPYPNDYYMAHSLDSRCAPGAMILMDDRTRCGTFLCIIEWVMRNVAKFHFEYSDVVVGVKAEWKDVFQLLISEEFGFKVFMKKPQKRLQLLRNLLFDEDIDEGERAECLNEYVHSITLPALTSDPNDESQFTRLGRLDNFRRKLEYLSKILAKFRRRKNKQVDWGVYLKRERDELQANSEGKPLSKLVKYKAIEFDESDEDGDSDEHSTRRIKRRLLNSKEYDSNEEDEEESEDDEANEEFSNNIKVNFNELVSAKDNSPELKATLNKINMNLAAGAATIYYSDEINKVIDERLEDIKVEEDAIHDELKSLDRDVDQPEKINYRNKIHPTSYDQVEILGKRLSSFSMANEFLTMEEPTVYVRNEISQSAEALQNFNEYDYSHLTRLSESCSEFKFVKNRLLRIVRENDLELIEGLNCILHSPDVNDGNDSPSPSQNVDDCLANAKGILGCYFELFKMIRITEEIGVSLELLKTLFSRDYLKGGLEDLMEKKLIFMVGVHNRKFISVEFIQSWSMPVKLKKSKFLNLKSSRRYIVHPWVTSGGQIEWKLVVKLLTVILSYMDSVSVTVDDLCRSMVPILSTVETLLLVECLVKLNVITLYAFEDRGNTSLWSKTFVSHYASRLQGFDAFLDLENLSVQLGPQYFKRFCDVQVLFKSMDSR